jgi:hypothetical protein
MVHADEARMPRVADALTLYLWRAPALRLASWTSEAEVPPAAFTIVESLLSLLVFALFWNGHYWPGLAISIGVMILSVAALVAERSAHSKMSEQRLQRALETIFPLLWWWGWAHGLAAYGRPLEPIYATMVLWVVLGGTIAIRGIEALALRRFNGMEIHAWQPLDTRFRLVSAARNANLMILAAALLAGRPDSGIVLIAWWTLISLIFHAVRFAQLTELQARRVKIGSWLDR